MSCKAVAVDALIMEFGERIDPEISGRVLALYRRLKELSLPGIVEIIPSYATLYLQFDLFRWEHESLCRRLRQIADTLEETECDEGRRVEIPVYYSFETGPDLERVASMHGLSVEEVIELHSRKEYRVYTVGFLPGFAYMGSVEERIATPRLETPRAKVPKGSVALANLQCAVYPLESPGGWNLLGRTPLELFDPKMEGFSLLQPGDLVRFLPIDREAYLAAGGEL